MQVAKGTVFQDPKGPYNDSQFDLSSICTSAKHLFGLPGFLSKRDAWAGSFDELLLDTPRSIEDTPMHLPAAPKPKVPFAPSPPISSSLDNQPPPRQLLDDGYEAATADENLPRHCSTNGDCAAPGEATQKQRNTIHQFAAAFGRELPAGMDGLSYHQAAEWLHQTFVDVAK